jgi:hypothetical protein
MRLDWVAGPLAFLARQCDHLGMAWGVALSKEARAMRAQLRSMERLRYHLGRGRRARDAGRFEDGAVEARKALAANPQSAWTLALLGQCLSRQRQPDPAGARRALERAQALEPTNGYFVRLLLDALEADGDIQGRANLLARAWWKGAPVERWLPEGPPMPRANATQTGAERATTEVPVPPTAAGVARSDSRSRARESVPAGHQPVGA